VTGSMTIDPLDADWFGRFVHPETQWVPFARVQLVFALLQPHEFTLEGELFAEQNSVPRDVLFPDAYAGLLDFSSDQPVFLPHRFPLWDQRPLVSRAFSGRDSISWTFWQRSLMKVPLLRTTSSGRVLASTFL
jgi:hypothetical protein